jgi:hypothetical protein
MREQMLGSTLANARGSGRTRKQKRERSGRVADAGGGEESKHRDSYDRHSSWSERGPESQDRTYVSQIVILTRRPSTVMAFETKSTPMVGWSASKVSLVKRSSRLDFPVPESPTSKILNASSKSAMPTPAFRVRALARKRHNGRARRGFATIPRLPTVRRPPCTPDRIPWAWEVEQEGRARRLGNTSCVDGAHRIETVGCQGVNG